MTNLDKEQSQDKENRRLVAPMGAGVAAGITLGVATGNVAIGLAIGLFLGGIGVARNRRKMREGQSGSRGIG